MSIKEMLEIKGLPYFAEYNALPCIMCTHFFGPDFQGKISFVLILI